MYIVPPLLALLPLTTALHAPNPQHLFANRLTSPISRPSRIPTVHESAVLARRILHLETIGTLSTIFPPSSHNEQHHATENRPSSVSNTPIGLMDYFADCEPSTGNPTILAITIATSFKNVAAGSNISLSLRWHRPDNRPTSAAALPRFSLVGYLEDISAEDVVRNAVPACFVRHHPDAAWWLPGNPIHESRWVRLVVREVYWIGGFGDRAYIGWIPAEEWKSVTKEEMEGVRLPGEKSAGWRAWLGLEGPEDVLEL